MILRVVAATLILLAAGAAVAAEPVTVVVGPGGAEEASKVVNALRGSGATVIVRVAGAAGDNDGAAAPGDGDGVSREADSLPALFSAGLRQGIEAIPAVPRMLGEIAAAWSRGTHSGGAVVLTWLAALLVAFAVHRAMRIWSPTAPHDRLAGRLAGAVVGLVRDLAAIAAFAAAGRVAVDFALAEPDFRRTVATAVLDGTALALLYVAGGRFLLAPGAPERRLLPLARADHHRALLVAYGVADQLINTSVDLGFAATAGGTAVEGWFLLADSAITVFAVWWFNDLRPDIRKLVRSCSVDPAAPSTARRLAASAAPWVMIAVTLLMWAVGRIAAVAPEGARWGNASEITQVLAVLVPLVAVGGAALLRGLLAPAPWADAPLGRALVAMAAATAQGAAWIGGLLVLAGIWGNFLSDAAVAVLARSLLDAIDDVTVLAVGWLTWSFVRALFDAYGPRPTAALAGGLPGELEVAPHSRLATVLPLLRGLALTSVAAVTLLVFLSRLGVNIGPLLAGAGVVGLAISFGSQALVRDIVSGIFFMTDDAFRVGEYIDTGRLKGVVEKLSLRSMLLRHQSGQLHTVPYGQIASVTNASRDWATVKFNIPLAHGVDLDRVRKLVKKVGQQLLADAEFGPEFIQPLKLQGMAQITGDGLVIRLKFTARPAKASWLQREALRRVYETLVDAGVAFPVGTLTASALASVPPGPAAPVAGTR